LQLNTAKIGGNSMGLSTHVLDTMYGCPAAGMAVQLFALQGEVYSLVKKFVLNADGRNPDGPLYDNASLKAGRYRLDFDVAAYYRMRGVELPTPAFLEVVGLDFGVAYTEQHYHVPLLCTPWSYSTYRGS
jgi:5-hydroxyisourate hydrolase